MAHTDFGTHRLVTGSNHYGLRDWLAQRVTATVMAVFTIVLLVQVLSIQGPIGFEQWAGIFSSPWMKALTFCTFVSIAYHVWVGVRDIWMDYVTNSTALRLVLHVLSLIWIIGSVSWAVQVLWRL